MNASRAVTTEATIKSANKSDAASEKASFNGTNHNFDLPIVGLKRKPKSSESDQKVPALPLSKTSAADRGAPSSTEQTVTARHSGPALTRAQSFGRGRNFGSKQILGVRFPNAKKQNETYVEPSVEKLDERRLAVSRLLGTQEPSGSTSRRSIRRARRVRSQRTLEASFTEISDDDLTVESTVECLYAESEDIVVEDEVCGYGTNECTTQNETIPLNQVQSGRKKSRRRGRRQSIGTISISVNIAQPTNTEQRTRISGSHSISNVTVQVNFGEENASSYTVNTNQSSTVQPTTYFIDAQQAHAKLENGASMTTAIVPVPPGGITTEGPYISASEADQSDSEGDYSCSESDAENSLSLEQIMPTSSEPLVANVSVQVNSGDNSDSDNDNESFSSDEHQLAISSVNNVPPSLEGPLSFSPEASDCEIAVARQPILLSEVTALVKPASLPFLNDRDSQKGPSLSAMSRSGLVDMVRSSKAPDGNLYTQVRSARTASTESSVRISDPLGSSVHSYKAENTESVEAYESAVSMQNIGLHNRYGFMVDDKEVIRSSTRRRSSLSFRTTTSTQGPSQAQMRNHCEPGVKRDSETKYPLSSSRCFELSNHGTGRSKGSSGSSRLGQRPPMQKSLSTRSMTKRPQLYHRASSRSMTQGQTIAEHAQLVEETPCVQPTFIQDNPTQHQEQQKAIPDMTIMYQRRSSKSLFSDNDDDLSYSDMGSVMSFDRDDLSVAETSVGMGSVMSNRTGRSTSNKSQGLSVLSRKLHVGKLIKKLSFRRRGSDETSSQAAKSARSNFFSKMLAKRGSKKDVEPWRALDSASTSYWADHLVASTDFNPDPAARMAGPGKEGRRIQRRASM